MAPDVAAGGRMPSLEWEPKTLTLEQLKFAREAALYVLSTNTTEEAIRIFTEGLKPVLSIRKSLMDSDDEEEAADAFDSDACVNGNNIHGRAVKRDIATAPF